MYYALQIQLEDKFHNYKIFEIENFEEDIADFADTARFLGKNLHSYLDVPVRVICVEALDYTIIWGSEYPPEDFNSEGFLADDTIYTLDSIGR